MKSFFRSRNAALALAVVAAFGLTACQTPAKNATAPAAAAQPAATQLKQREIGFGLYEMAYVPGAKALYVASADAFKDVSGGVIYRLDPDTLETTGKGYTDLKNFGMTMNRDGSVLYVTNSLDGGVSKIDPVKGKVLARTLFSERNKEGYPYGAREIFLHDDRLYIGGVGDPGVIWVVDAQSMKLKTRIKNAGKWVTGIIYSPVTDRLYAANGGGEILVINPRSHKIEKRLTPGDDKTYLLLNMAEDPATGRLFVTDNSKAKTTLVFDERSGKVIRRIDGDALGIKFNAKRNEIYISQRESQKVLQLDATTCAVKNSWSFDGHPNSLLVTPDGQTLYVTIKQGFNKDHSSKGPDSVARINLN
ncbi:YncE family protein [Pantoea sp. KPR_PJ]|uniref:YncE family protein n=1 Tax=Pantoea sp. KPR_PJ TaxID=2738375 RepID=UPI0035282034